MPVIKQRQQAERLRNLWANYMSIPLVIEQFMTWLDDFPPEIVIYAIKQTARKRALLKGDMSFDYVLAYATKTMANELERRREMTQHDNNTDNNPNPNTVVFSEATINRVKTLTAAEHDPRFAQYTKANIGQVLAAFEPSGDVQADAAKLLAEIAEDHIRQSGIEADRPVYDAAKRAVEKHGDSTTFDQIASELAAR